MTTNGNEPRPQMVVRVYRNGNEIGTFVAPWGSQLRATMEDAIDHYEIRIDRYEPPQATQRPSHAETEVVATG